MMKTVPREEVITWYHKVAFVVVILGSLILFDTIHRESVLRKAKKDFRLTDQMRPQTYTFNEFEDHRNVVVDLATGLTWQKSGKPEEVTYAAAEQYVKQLNQERFNGYNDWRLPRLLELMSLLEPEKQSNELYIDPIFDVTQWKCWSVEKRSWRAAWGVSFARGDVGWIAIHPNHYSYVRAVRP